MIFPMTEDDYECMKAEQLYKELHPGEDYPDWFFEPDEIDLDALDAKYREQVENDEITQLQIQEFELLYGFSSKVESSFFDHANSKPNRVTDCKSAIFQPLPISQSVITRPTNHPNIRQDNISSPQTVIQEKAKRGHEQDKVVGSSTLPQKVRSSPYEVAQGLLMRESIVISGNALYHYNGIIYSLLEKEDMKRLIMDRCRTAVADFGDAGFVEAIYRVLLTEPRICNKNFAPSQDEVAFIDGVLNLNTGMFLSHSPNFFVTSYLTASYRNGVSSVCPNFDAFISGIAEGDMILEQRIWEVIGYFLTQDHNGKCFVIFQGPHDSGKSLLGNFIRDCFNKESVSSLDLHSFGNDFALAHLIGKRLCLDLDLPSGTIKARAVSFLKKLTGGDILSTNVKYMPRVTFVNSAKLLFATNHSVITDSDDDAFQRRLVAVPFRHTVSLEHQDFNLREKLGNERDAVVVKALGYYHNLRLQKYNFAGDFAVNENVSDSNDLYTSIMLFLRDTCIVASNSWISTETLYNEFIQENQVFCHKKEFSRFLKRIISKMFTNVYKQRGRIDGIGNPVSGFYGLALSKQESLDSSFMEETQ